LKRELDKKEKEVKELAKSLVDFKVKSFDETEGQEIKIISLQEEVKKQKATIESLELRNEELEERL